MMKMRPKKNFHSGYEFSLNTSAALSIGFSCYLVPKVRIENIYSLKMPVSINTEYNLDLDLDDSKNYLQWKKMKLILLSQTKIIRV